MTMPRPGKSGVQIPVGTNDYSLPAKPVFQWVPPVFFPGVNRPAREVNHSFLVPMLRMSGAILPLPPTCLNGVDRENFTFTFTDNHVGGN